MEVSDDRRDRHRHLHNCDRSPDYRWPRGYLQALDARTGTLLWKTNLGAEMLNNPITYAVNGKQYIAAGAGLSLFVFAC